jgi:hypothetical protein
MELDRLPISELEQTLVLDESSQQVQYLLNRYAVAAGAINSTIDLKQYDEEDEQGLIAMREALLAAQLILSHVWEGFHGELDESTNAQHQESELNFADIAAELCDIGMLAAAHEMDDLVDPILDFLTQSLPDIVPVKVGMITALIGSGRLELAEALASQTLHAHPSNESAIAGLGLSMKALHREGWPLLFQHLHSTSVDDDIVDLASDMLAQVGQVGQEDVAQSSIQ